MLFSSLTFLYYFLPFVILVYLLVPTRMTNTILLLASLIFSAWNGPRFTVLLSLLLLASYFFLLLIERTQKYAVRKWLCTILIITHLIFFLYTVTDSSLSSASSGIYFLTLSMISCCVEVFKSRSFFKDPISFFCYLMLFPKFIAGPVISYPSWMKQLQKRALSFSLASEGIRRFLIGLSKKILLADQLSELIRMFDLSSEKSILFYWIYAVASLLQLYYMLTAYSDMAIGLGKLFGFHFPETMREPLSACSISELLHRWQITLGEWFQTYVFDPLCKLPFFSRHSAICVFISGILISLWHRLSLPTLTLGLFFSALFLLEKKYLLDFLSKHRFLAHLYVPGILLCSIVVFQTETLSQAGTELTKLLGFGGIPLVSAEALYYLKSFSVTLLISILFTLPFARRLLRSLLSRVNTSAWYAFAEPVFFILLLLLCTAFLL